MGKRGQRRNSGYAASPQGGTWGRSQWREEGGGKGGRGRGKKGVSSIVESNAGWCLSSTMKANGGGRNDTGDGQRERG